jgi:UDP-N-acetyl-2-amino-2-deoxyglucuronate dehydrogenase
MKTWRIGLVGCGAIAEVTYMPQLTAMPHVEISALCDVIPGRAEEYARRWSVPAACYESIDDMLAGGGFEILLDTASIQAHYEINLKALQAGKHLYSQKPFALTVEDATTLIEEARKRSLKMSISPVHMLRPEIQEAKRLVGEGVIGKVAFVRCSSSHGGPEYFQYRDVDPTWFYQPGAGPMYDMGVHGLHQVTGLLGPASSVACLSGISEKVRTVRTGAFDGSEIEPQVDDNMLLLLDFGDATFAFVDCTYCVKASRSPHLEIFGSEGTITLSHDREHRLQLFKDDMQTGVRGWVEPLIRWPEFQHAYCVKDLWEAIEEDRKPVLSPEHARHVVEIMSKCYVAAREGRTVPLETSF